MGGQGTDSVVRLADVWDRDGRLRLSSVTLCVRLPNMTPLVSHLDATDCEPPTASSTTTQQAHAPRRPRDEFSVGYLTVFHTDFDVGHRPLSCRRAESHSERWQPLGEGDQFCG